MQKAFAFDGKHAGAIFVIQRRIQRAEWKGKWIGIGGDRADQSGCFRVLELPFQASIIQRDFQLAGRYKHARMLTQRAVLICVGNGNRHGAISTSVMATGDE